MKTNSRFLFAASLVLAFTFTLSCSSSNDNGGVVGNAPGTSSPSGGGGDLDSQVYYYEDGSLYIGSGVISIESTNLNAGEVINGKINLQLPTVPYVLLEALWPDAEGCTFIPNDIRGLFGDCFTINIGGSKECLTLGAGDGKGDISQAIFYWYFSSGGKITCSSRKESESSGSITISNVNIDAQAGWNKIYYVKFRNSSTNTRSYDYSTNNILTQEVKWFIVD